MEQDDEKIHWFVNSNSEYKNVPDHFKTFGIEQESKTIYVSVDLIYRIISEDSLEGYEKLKSIASQKDLQIYEYRLYVDCSLVDQCLGHISLIRELCDSHKNICKKICLDIEKYTKNVIH